MSIFVMSLGVTTQACNPAAWSLSRGTQQTLLPPLPSCQNPGNADTPKIFYNCSKLVSQIIIKQKNLENQKGATKRKRRGQREGWLGWNIPVCKIGLCEMSLCDVTPRTLIIYNKKIKLIKSKAK